jgi:hypothetical protein
MCIDIADLLEEYSRNEEEEGGERMNACDRATAL